MIKTIKSAKPRVKVLVSSKGRRIPANFFNTKKLNYSLTSKSN